MNKILKEGLWYTAVGLVSSGIIATVSKAFPELYSSGITEYLKETSTLEYVGKVAPYAIGLSLAMGTIGVGMKSARNFLEDILMGSVGLTRED